MTVTTPHLVPGLVSCELDTPVGRLTVVASDKGVRAVLWDRDSEAERTRAAASGAVPVDAADHPVLAAAVVQLQEYFAGTRQEFDLPLDVVGTAFQRDAWRALQTIPYGSTVSYGEQARRLGNPKAVRAVGAANSRNPVSIVVPCHRVVGSDGSLTGFAAGVDVKAWLLDHERRVLART
jgi:methylated-DNA-[protein]-cysteine S-methyltransferase